MTTGRAVGLALLLLGPLAGCGRNRNTVRLVAPFDQDVTLGEVTATWDKSGEERAFAGGTRLREPEVRFQYRLDVRNRLGDKLFVRLARFQLVGPNGLGLATDPASVECTLSAGNARAILSGEVWIPKSKAEQARGFQVMHFAVPLNERGRALYREWLLQGRPQRSGDVDSEIARYAAAPPCPQG
jgi:hypothetical protein